MTESNQRNNELAQLEELFGTTDLLSIVGVKNKEAYLEAPTDTFTGTTSIEPFGRAVCTTLFNCY